MLKLRDLWRAVTPRQILEANSKANKHDAIVALANLMNENGTLNDESRERMNLAVDAFAAGDAPLIVTCGWAYRTDTPLSIADAMRTYAIEAGVPRAAVLAEADSRDTVGHAIFTKIAFAIPKAWRTLLVVTSDYHVQRVHEIFSFVYASKYFVEVRGAPSRNTTANLKREDEAMRVFRATFVGVSPGDDAGILRRLRERHPFYNDVIHPKI